MRAKYPQSSKQGQKTTKFSGQGGRSQQSSTLQKKAQTTSGNAKDPMIPKSWRMISGTHAIQEALNVRPGEVKEFWFKQGWESSSDLRDFHQMALAKKIKPEVKQTAFLDRICASHQGAVLLVDGAPQLNIHNLKKHETSKVLLLDGIEDPHNLGAIVRTAWLMDVHGVIIPEDRAVGLTPTAHKVACGGVEHVPVMAVHGFDSTLQALKDQGYWVFGLSHKAAKNVFEMNIPEKIVWAIGAEDKGLRITTERMCDELVSIPQISAQASYNASVATAIALTETYRQHQKVMALHGKSKILK